MSEPALGNFSGGAFESLEPGQIADVSAHWRPLYGQMAAKLRRGLLVTCDYGFPIRQLLDARIRSHGTLACYRRQQVHRNPLIQVGEQDLTAHVDFTALMEEGEASGLETAALTRQAAWLTSCGIFEGLAEAESAPLLDFLYSHTTRPEFTCRVQWEPRTLLLWDNRCTMHYALDDYPDYDRLMFRVSVSGDRPA